MPSLSIRHETWPLQGTFRISRGAKTQSEVITVTVAEGGNRGRGEGTPYARYGESIKSVTAQIEAVRTEIERGASRLDLLGLMSAGAGRNAVDCALWDLEAKQSARRVWDLADMPPPVGLQTAYSLSLDTPENMAQVAERYADWPLLKLKLTGEGDLDRVRAVRQAAPDARLIVDANEGWNAKILAAHDMALAALGVELIEQPLPADADIGLISGGHKLRVCADEACHTAADIPDLKGRYDVVNIKLDKSGGLTEALRLLAAAQSADLGIMVGCMVSSSLSMAPAMIVATGAEFVDLDGPLLLAQDRPHPILIDHGRMQLPDINLWG